MLTGLLYCGCCGNRLCYSHNTTHRKLADGTEKDYEITIYWRITADQFLGKKTEASA